jgi:hypothetical protein
VRIEQRSATTDYATKSGGREPAVVIGIALTTALPLTHGRPPTVPVPVAGAFASRLTTGAYAPRSCVAVRTHAGETTIFTMHKRTFDQERRASARRGYRYRTYNGASTNSRQTADGVCADPRCNCVYGRHGANVAPESYMRHTAPDYNRVHRRHGGLTPPALVLRCERLPAKQQFLRCTNAHSTKSGGRQPAVVIGIADALVFVRRGWLTPAALGCTRFVRCEVRDSQCGVAHTTRSGGRQPAVARQTRIGRHEHHSSADRRRCACGSPLRSRLWVPRG